jgi:hypothetical protein
MKKLFVVFEVFFLWLAIMGGLLGLAALNKGEGRAAMFFAAVAAIAYHNYCIWPQFDDEDEASND